MHQKLIVFRTIIEITLIIVSLWFHKNFSRAVLGPEIWCYYALNIFSLITLVLTIYQSKNFTKLLMHFNTYASNFPADQTYLKNVDRKKKILMFVFIFYNAIKCTGDMLYYVYIDDLVLDDISVIYCYLFEANAYMCYLRFLYEFPVIYCFLFLIAEEINCITRSVNEEIEQQAFQSKINSSLCSKLQLLLFDKWSASYAIVAKISKLCNVIFGLQVLHYIRWWHSPPLYDYNIINYYTGDYYQTTSNGFNPWSRHKVRKVAARFFYFVVSVCTTDTGDIELSGGAGHVIK